MEHQMIEDALEALVLKGEWVGEFSENDILWSERQEEAFLQLGIKSGTGRGVTSLVGGESRTSRKGSGRSRG